MKPVIWYYGLIPGIISMLNMCDAKTDYPFDPVCAKLSQANTSEDHRLILALNSQTPNFILLTYDYHFYQVPIGFFDSNLPKAENATLTLESLPTLFTDKLPSKTVTSFMKSHPSTGVLLLDWLGQSWLLLAHPVSIANNCLAYNLESGDLVNVKECVDSKMMPNASRQVAFVSMHQRRYFISINNGKPVQLMVIQVTTKGRIKDNSTLKLGDYRALCHPNGDQNQIYLSESSKCDNEGDSTQFDRIQSGFLDESNYLYLFTSTGTFYTFFYSLNNPNSKNPVPLSKGEFDKFFHCPGGIHPDKSTANSKDLIFKVMIITMPIMVIITISVLLGTLLYCCWVNGSCGKKTGGAPEPVVEKSTQPKTKSSTHKSKVEKSNKGKSISKSKK